MDINTGHAVFGAFVLWAAAVVGFTALLWGKARSL